MALARKGLIMYRVVLYKDRQREWRWRIVGRNNRIIANAGEGYRRKVDCLRMVTRLVTGTLPYQIIDGATR